MSMPFYVSPEQVMKDRADYARKGIARGRSLVALECAAGVLIVADNPSRTLRRSARSTTASRSRRSASTTSSRCCAWPACATPTSRATRTHARTCSAKELANAYAQTLRQVFTHEMKPYEVELLVVEVGHGPATTTPRCTTCSTTASSWTSSATRCSAAQAEAITEALAVAVHRRAWSSAPPCELGAKVLGTDGGAARRRRSSRSRCSTAAARAARSAASRTPSSKELLASG